MDSKLSFRYIHVASALLALHAFRIISDGSGRFELIHPVSLVMTGIDLCDS